MKYDTNKTAFEKNSIRLGQPLILKLLYFGSIFMASNPPRFL